MGKVLFNMSVSLDGFVAGANDDVEKLFEWYYQGDTDFSFPGSEDQACKVSRASADLLGEYGQRLGATLTGRRTFDLSGAWEGKPPSGLPTVVMTHHPPVEWMKPGSPFTFVTDGVESGVATTKRIARDKDVVISGANVLQQCLKAGLVDELIIDQVSLLLGQGVRLFENHVDEPRNLKIARVIPGIGVTHLCYVVEN